MMLSLSARKVHPLDGKPWLLTDEMLTADGVRSHSPPLDRLGEQGHNLERKC